VSSGTQLHFRCAAFPNGCMSQLIIPAPPGFEPPPGMPGSAAYIKNLDDWLAHHLDRRVADHLHEHGWHLAFGKWVCQLHPER
jgi:hypothetical protein